MPFVDKNDISPLGVIGLSLEVCISAVTDGKIVVLIVLFKDLCVRALVAATALARSANTQRDRMPRCVFNHWFL